MPTTLSQDPTQADLLIVDTTPHGADPDVPLSFDTPEFDDHLDPQAFAEEPFDDVDPEAEEDEHDGELSFGDGPLALADTSTRERWLQSALKATVAPQLDVDGILGPKTSRAVTTFQRRSASLGGGALRTDGIAGPRTIAALERVTKSTAPAQPGAVATPIDDDQGDETEVGEHETPEDEPEVQPEVRADPNAVTAPNPVVDTRGDLTVRELKNADGVVEYHVSAGDQTVSFSYWTPDWKNYKPYNVSRYRGARKGLLTDAQIEAIGYSSSELKILKANALKESNGAFGAMNTWDDQIVSWGMAQFAGQAGTLAVLLAELKESPRTRASFKRWFADNGIDVARGDYPWKGGKTKTGWHVVVTDAAGKAYRGNDGWNYIRTQPRLIGAFMLAGNDPQIQLGQIEYWRRSFLSRAIAKRVAQKADGSGGGAVRKYVTSERGLAVLVRLHNWMPGYVVSWSNRFIGELQKTHADRDLSEPFHWDQALEDAFVKKVCDERKRVKSGSYDTYALDLSTRRDSFKIGRESSAV